MVTYENPFEQSELYSDTVLLHYLGRFVKEHRIAQNRSQEALAHDAAISRSTLSLLERGEPVTLLVLLRVLRVLHKLDAFHGLQLPNRIRPMQMALEEEKARYRVRKSSKNNPDNPAYDW
jgi:transcriptional regulator with XRE-family HTH domain